MGSWAVGVRGLGLRRVTFWLMVRVGVSESEIGVLGRGWSFFVEEGVVGWQVSVSGPRALSAWSSPCEGHLGGVLYLGFSGLRLASVHGLIVRSFGGVDIWIADGAFRVRFAFASAGTFCFCAF